MKTNALYVLGIIFVTFISFSSTLNNELTNWDDTEHVTDNPTVISRDIGNIPQHFQTDVLRQYIPLTTYSFALEYFFFGPDPFIYHLDNLLLHVLTGVLIYLFALCMRFTPLAAFFGALLFGVHPIHVESVAWVTERKDVLYAFFYMLALWSYARYLNGQKRRDYLFSLFWGLLSVLSKPMALSLPLICFLCDWYYGRKIDRKAVLEKVPYFLYIIPLAGITYYLHSRIPGESVFSAALIWMWSATFYLEKFVVFFDLSPYYVLSTPVSPANPVYLKGAVLFLLSVAAIFIFRRARVFLFAVFYYFLSLFFLFKFDAGDVSVVADRYMYLPSLGICLALGAGLAYLWEHKKAHNAYLLILCFLLFGGLSLETYRQTDLWQDSVRLWNRVVEKYPHHPKGYANRGSGYLQSGSLLLAYTDLSKAVSMNPRDYKSFTNRGKLYYRFGQMEQAIADFDQSVKLRPDFDKAYGSRALVYAARKDYAAAVRDFHKALELDPYDYRTLNNRGIVYGHMKEYDLAYGDFNRAIQIAPDTADIFNNRGLIYYFQEDFQQALQDFNRAVALNSEFADALFNRGRLYAESGDYANALEDLQKAEALGHPHSASLLMK